MLFINKELNNKPTSKTIFCQINLFWNVNENRWITKITNPNTPVVIKIKSKDESTEFAEFLPTFWVPSYIVFRGCTQYSQ